MSDNPYEPPSGEARGADAQAGRPEDLRSVALYQKRVILCICWYVVPITCQIALGFTWVFFPSIQIPIIVPIEIIIGLAALGIVVVGVVSLVRLTLKVYERRWGTVLSILIFIPCTSGIVLLLVCVRATRMLKRNGIRVGLLGANPAQFEKR